MNTTPDLVRARYPAFADLRDRYGLKTVRQDGWASQWSAALHGPRFNLYIGVDRSDQLISVGLPGGKSQPIANVLRRLGLWTDVPYAQYDRQLASAFEANLDRVLHALQHEDFSPRPPRASTLGLAAFLVLKVLKIGVYAAMGASVILVLYGLLTK